MQVATLASNRKIDLSIIVPVYNEQAVLSLFHQAVDEVIADMESELVEIIYINDGSSDQSWSVMQALTSAHAQVRCLNLSRNFGKEAAMTAGIDASLGEAVIFLDADLQDPPELIPSMLDTWRQGFDVVNMKRKDRQGESRFKIFSAHCYYRLLEAMSDSPIEKDVGDFRLLSRRVVEQIKALPERNRYMKGIMSWPGFKKTTMYFDRPERAAGETKWSFLQLVRLGLAGITSFSVKPLKLATWAGALISAVAFVYAAWVMLKTLFIGEVVTGYPSLMLVQLFLGGVQLLAIGIMGEYIGRIFTETKGRPIYIVMDEEVAPSVKPESMRVKRHG